MQPGRVDEAMALVEHGRVPKRSIPGSAARSAAGGILALALVGAPKAASADPLYAPGAALPSPSSPAAWTRVRLVTTAPKVVLERRLGSLPGDPQLPRGLYADDEPRWQAVCAASCDTAVQLGGEYRIAGEGVTASSAFSLHGPATELRVDAGSYGVRRAGVYLAVIGFVGAAAGGIFLGVAALQHPASGIGAGGYASIAGLAAGGTLGVVGVGMAVGSGTSVRDETRRELARVTPPSVLHATFQF